MKKSKCFLQKRILPLVTVFMVVLSALVVSAPCAEAVVYDYNDYIQSIKVDGDNDLVTVSLPIDRSSYFIYYVSSSQWTEVGEGLCGVPFVAPQELYSSGTVIRINPLGIYERLNYLNMTNIPADSAFNMSFGIGDNISSYDTPILGARIQYYRDYVLMHQQYIRYDTYPISDFSVSGIFEYQGDMASLEVEIRDLVINGSYGQSITLYCNTFTLQMSISSLYRLQQEVGETNEILEAVKAELIDQGTTLDAVLTKLGVIEGKIDSGLSWLQSIYTTLQNIFSGIQSLVSSLGSSIGSGIQQITSGVASLVTGQQQTNSDLDEIINGGEIVDPGVSDAVDQFDDQISGVTDFENQVQNDFSQQFDAVLADFDGIGDLGPAFNFLGGYAGTLFVSLQDYSFIIILPIMIGVFMAICQHFPRGSLRGRSYSEHVSFSQSELQSHRDAQSELASTRSWVDRDS